jgi:hypothetical protein
MKRLASLLGIGLVSLLATGCVGISVGGGKQSPPPPPSPLPSPPVIVGAPADAATVAEIDGAARLSMDATRAEALRALAQRPGLSPTAQVHLVNVAYRCLSFDSSKVSVLQAVIANPAFCDPTRQAIAAQLGGLSFDASKQTILSDLNRRVTTPPSP